MTIGLIGKKVGMTQVFDAEGLAVPVTVVQLGDNLVVRKLTQELNGYTAIQVGGFKVKENRLTKLTKPALGHFKKAGVAAASPLKEFRVNDVGPYNVGDELKAGDVIPEGILVDVRGRSIGKGFQGTIKRYNAGRGPMAHGSKFHRSMGSIGAGTTPGRVLRGMKMPGHMGGGNVCSRHHKVIKIDAEKNVLLLKGEVPGSEGGLIVISPSKTKWN